MTQRKLYRSDDRILLGVCQGLADWTSIPVFVVRLVFIVAALSTSVLPSLLVYLIVGLIIPARPACNYSCYENCASDWKRKSESDEEYRRRKREAEWDNKFCNS